MHVDVCRVESLPGIVAVFMSQRCALCGYVALPRLRKAGCFLGRFAERADCLPGFVGRDKRMPARSRALQPCFPVTLQPWIQCVRAGTTHFAVETLAYQPLYIISRIQHYQLTEMIRDDIRSQIQIQIEQIESS